MTADKRTTEQLWEFVYGLQPDDEAVALCERIQSDPDLARAYATVKLQSDLLADAARFNEPTRDAKSPAESVSLPPTTVDEAPGGSIRSDKRSHQLGRFSTVRRAFALAAGLLLLLGIGSYTMLDPTANRPTYVVSRLNDSAVVDLSLTLPDKVYREINNPVLISVSGREIPTQVELRVYDVDDNLRLQHQSVTDGQGNSRVALPGNILPDQGRIEVNSMDGIPVLVRSDLNVSSSESLTFVAADRFVYQPGDELGFRSVTMPQLGSAFPVENLVVQLQDAEGNTIRGGELTMETTNGVAAGRFVIPPESAEGSYQLLARSDNDANASQRFDVRRSTTDKDGVRGTTDEFVAQQATGGGSTPTVEFYPEGGNLVAGVPNRVYFFARDQSREAISVGGVIVNSREDAMTEVRSLHRGRGHFTVVPELGENYRLVETPVAQLSGDFQLPPAVAGGVALHAEVDIFSPEHPIEVELRVAEPRQDLILTASSRQATVGLEKVLSDEFEAAADHGYVVRRQIPVAAETSGLVEITVFDVAATPAEAVAERVVFFRPAQSMTVQVVGIRGTYQPGEQITLTVLTTDEGGVPRSSILGASLAPAIGSCSQLAASFPTYHYLISDLGERVNFSARDCDWAESTDPGAALDLLLGTLAPIPERVDESLESQTAARYWLERAPSEASGSVLARRLGRIAPRVVRSDRITNLPQPSPAPTRLPVHRLIPVALVASMIFGLLLVGDILLAYLGQRRFLAVATGFATVVMLAAGIWWAASQRTIKVAGILPAERPEAHFRDQSQEVGQDFEKSGPTPTTEQIGGGGFGLAGVDELKGLESDAAATDGAESRLGATALKGLGEDAKAGFIAAAPSGPPESALTNDLQAEAQSKTGALDVANSKAAGFRGGAARPEAIPSRGATLAESPDRILGETQLPRKSVALGRGADQEQTGRRFAQVLPYNERPSLAFGEIAEEEHSPVLITDENGRASVTIQLPSSPGVLRLHIDAQSANRMGATEAEIVVGTP